MKKSDTTGPNRGEADSDTSATASIRLRFDARGRAAWEAASDELCDDGTARLLAVANDDSADDGEAEVADDTVGWRALVAYDED
ncbi:MAG TPA: hypothetical protein VLD39_07105 [Gammaproteobacteria bacterium]|nr:hypothetical protein [Gammaproteobacteria bacterium]